jgi:hypothetical protein
MAVLRCNPTDRRRAPRTEKVAPANLTRPSANARAAIVANFANPR